MVAVTAVGKTQNPILIGLRQYGIQHLLKLFSVGVIHRNDNIDRRHVWKYSCFLLLAQFGSKIVFLFYRFQLEVSVRYVFCSKNRLFQSFIFQHTYGLVKVFRNNSLACPCRYGLGSLAHK